MSLDYEMLMALASLELEPGSIYYHSEETQNWERLHVHWLESICKMKCRSETTVLP